MKGLSVTMRDMAVTERCVFGRTLDGLDPTDAEAIEAFMARPTAEVGNNWLKGQLREAGLRVADRTMRRHRARACICYGIHQKDYTRG